jgi:hypothetical protein
MTEDEAKKKWCPFSRVRGEYDDGNIELGSWNRWDLSNAKNDTLAYRVGSNLEVVRCIASECMAWRWVQKMMNEDDFDQNMVALSYPKKRVKAIYENTENGYCGLAGKP